jgi:AcrR family transcriptional regulator
VVVVGDSWQRSASPARWRWNGSSAPRPIGGQLRVQLGRRWAAALDVLGLEPVSHDCVQRLTPIFIRHAVFYTTQCPAKARISDVAIRKYEQRRRAEAAEETRRRILDAVYEQLRAAPAEPISIDRIARAAEVARSTVYVVFGSRAGLFDALGEDLLHRAGFQRMLRQSRQPDARESLRAAIYELAAMYAAERDVIRALVSLAQLDTGAFSGAIRRLEERRARGMTDLARQPAREKPAREKPAREIASVGHAMSGESAAGA